MEIVINRLKEEHEDETNYKLIEKVVEREVEVDKEVYFKLSKHSINDCINCMKKILENML